MLPWPIAVPALQEGVCTREHERALTASKYASWFLYLLWLTKSDLRGLADLVGVKQEAIRNLLVGRTTTSQTTLETWYKALLTRAQTGPWPSGWPQGVRGVIRRLDDTSSWPPERTLWYHRNHVYRWPNRPRTLTADDAISWYPGLIAHIATDTMSIHPDLRCLCQALELCPAPILSRSDGWNWSNEPPMWNNQDAFLRAWGLPPLTLSPATIRRRVAKDPAQLVQSYLNARISS